MEIITASVGNNGKNKYKDVVIVQELLNHCLHLLAGTKALDADGKIGAKTIAAITSFQARVVLMSQPDGRVDPGGKSLKFLNEKAVSTKKTHAVAVNKKSLTGYKFPLKSRSPESYKTRMRRFGANRSRGRKHSGCDLYAPIGTPIMLLMTG
jgi:peptidoglycan hydrolase-like protein with peptidoglycan-binding domain